MNVDHATIMVRSPTESAAYYGALLPLLGFSKLQNESWKNDSGFHLQFLVAKADTHSYERYGPGLNHLGFSAPDPDSVHAIRAAMIRAGFPAPEVQIIGGATALFMKDPDGLRFEITHYPPGVNVID
jgi:lactoylglutathione lyase